MNNAESLVPIELYDIWYRPFWHHTFFLLIIGILVSVLLAVLIYMFVRHYVPRNAIVQTPDQEALEKLSSLAVDNALSKVPKQFYTQLTLILKKYFTRRYGIQLMSCTDKEVLQQLSTKEFPSFLLDKVDGVFNGALYIKFSNQEQAQTHMKQDLKDAVEIIEKTRQL